MSGDAMGATLQPPPTSEDEAAATEAGMSERATEDEQDAVQTEQRRGRGRPKNQRSIDALRPWIAEGISRRTWFRKRAAEKANGIRAGGDDGFQQRLKNRPTGLDLYKLWQSPNPPLARNPSRS
jgi:hypothetical protein